MSSLLLLLTLLGCEAQPAAPTGAALAQQRVTATRAATYTPLPTETALPPPATYTPYPTYTPLPTWTPTPVPTATPIAFVPQVSEDWPTVIRRTADILAGNPAALERELRRLQAISATEGAVRTVDLTHDGQDELIIWYIDPNNANRVTRSNILVLTEGEGVWQPIFDATFGLRSSEGAWLLEARDLNNDLQSELAYAIGRCGSNGCSVTVRVVLWSGGAFRDLTASEIQLPSLREATFSDEDGDNLWEMALTGGTLDAIAAGPQRERTDIYRWVNNLYTLAETTYAESDWLPLVVWEANEAFDEGRYEAAEALYHRALTDETLRIWAQGTGDAGLQDSELTLLHSFSYFRLMVIGSVLEDQNRVDRAIRALRDQYPRSPMLVLAEAFLEAQGEGIPAACTAVTEAAAGEDGLLDALNSFGYTSPQFLPEDICPL